MPEQERAGPAAHAGYIAAVAAALEASGIPVADWRADGRIPRDGWIPFDLVRQVRLHGWPVWDHDEAGIGWSEENGWHLFTVDDPAGRGIRTVEGLDLAVIAAPAAVARTVAGLAGLPLTGPAAQAALVGRGSEGRVADPFAGHRAEAVDPGFEEALLRYSGSRTKAR
ncbi:DUF6292 family protein [Actinoplanes utahensis]|uniref:DUF6292 domain-containing protein n=1 Tax=Actinoplanes utahensis TaxID=1869 RepID=A0A0A6UD31_ACTUT|nr:DUF6292 family protein [Actinoplanes utahensis]KHD72199.1 hypothetical protein MB27_41945 [Actinoplanes utahensis]GIF27542.1 hypothetical protein Aut01nite_05280 [Actinoplanes utahensis]